MIDYSKILSQKVVDMKPSGIRKFFDILNEVPGVISLTVGEPDFKTPWHVREAAIASLEKGKTTYTSNTGLLEFRKQIANYLERRFDVSYDPSCEMIITVGGSEAIDLAIRAIVMVLGCVVLSIGMSVVINSQAGTGPNDLIAIVISDKLPKIQFRFVRIGCDVFFIIIGFLLGGVVGIGTVVAAFLTGPLVQFWLPKTKALIKKLNYE